MLPHLIPFIHCLLQFSSTPLPSVHFLSSLIFSTTLTFYLQSISFCVLSLAILSLYDFLPPLFISFLPILPFTSNLSPFMYFLSLYYFLPTHVIPSNPSPFTYFPPLLFLFPTSLRAFFSYLLLSPPSLSCLAGYFKVVCHVTRGKCNKANTLERLKGVG